MNRAQPISRKHTRGRFTRQSSNDNANSETSPLGTPLKLLKTNNYFKKVPKKINAKPPAYDVGFGFDSDNMRDILSSHRKAIPCLKYWNDLPGVPHHTMIGTKVRKTSSKYIRKLMRGVFFNQYAISADFIKRNSIDLPSMLGRPLSIYEIQDTMYHISKFYHRDYWPADKTLMPRSLPDVIWHPKAHNSLFLQAIFNPTERLDQPTALENKHPAITKMFIDTLNLSINGDERKFINGISALIEFRKKIKPDNYGKVKYWFGTDMKLCYEYAKWISEQDWLIPSIHVINPTNKLFIHFIEDQEKDLGIALR